MLGGLLGGLLSSLLYNDDYESSRYYFIFVCGGSVGFGGCMYLWLVLKEMKDPYTEDQARKREAQVRTNVGIPFCAQVSVTRAPRNPPHGLPNAEKDGGREASGP